MSAIAAVTVGSSTVPIGGRHDEEELLGRSRSGSCCGPAALKTS